MLDSIWQSVIVFSSRLHFCTVLLSLSCIVIQFVHQAETEIWQWYRLALGCVCEFHSMFWAVYGRVLCCRLHYCIGSIMIEHILLVIHYSVYRAVCFQFTKIPSWWLKEYIALSYYHHQIGSMNYYLLFRVRPWNNSMRCISLYILMCLYGNARDDAIWA